MTTWLHRISHCAATAYTLLDRGYLTIGFSDFSNAEFVDRTRSLDGAYFDASIREAWNLDRLPRSRHSLWKFLVSMKAGDRVIVPGQGCFSVYEVLDDAPLRIEEVDATDLKTWVGETVSPKDGLLSCNDETVDLGFARRVKTLAKDLSRSLFADAKLTSRMKIRETTADISDLKESVDRALEGYNANTPINLHATLLKHLTQTTLDAISNDLTPDKFEQLIAWYFRKVGATKVESPAKNESGKDGDADIIATFEPLKTIIYVQAKKHHGETSSWAVNQIKAYRDKKDGILSEEDSMDDGYTRNAWVISTAESFSTECIAVAKQNKVLLLNGTEFVRLMLNAGIEGLDSTQL